MRDASNPSQLPALQQLVREHPDVSLSHFLSITDRNDEALTHAERAWWLCVEAGPSRGYLPELPWACAVCADRLNRLKRHAEAEELVKCACRFMARIGEGCFTLGSILDLQWQYIEAVRSQGREPDAKWQAQLEGYRRSWAEEASGLTTP